MMGAVTLGFGEKPGQRNLPRRFVSVAGDLFDLVEQIKIFVGQYFLHAAEPFAVGRRLVTAIFAGEEAATQRTVGDDADVELFDDGVNIALKNFSLDQRPMRLYRNIFADARLTRGENRFHELPAVVIGATHVTHFALMHQIIHRAHGLFDGRVEIGRVRLIKIDGVGLQTAQRVFNGAHDVKAAQPFAVCSVPHAPAHFGRQHNVLAIAFFSFIHLPMIVSASPPLSPGPNANIHRRCQ